MNSIYSYVTYGYFYIIIHNIIGIIYVYIIQYDFRVNRDYVQNLIPGGLLN